MIADRPSVMEYILGPATVRPPTLKPAISPNVHLSLTVVYTALYSGLFIFIYLQLWLILCYRHKRLSYQSVFLFLCLAWSALRITLFSFYYRNCVAANNLNTFLYWLLYCCPVALQFITLCLMVDFFAGVYFRSLSPDVSQKYKGPLYASITISAVAFLATNIICAVILKRYNEVSESVPIYIIWIRVSISGCLFLLMSTILCVCIYKMSKVTDSTVVLEAKGLRVGQACTACTLIILLYTSRVVYNFIAISKPLSSLISFGYDWINASDQADFENLNQGFAYVSFGVVLFVWEFLPTFIVVLFFRVHRPDETSRTLSKLPSDSFSSRAYFFDNPRHYDSDDDLSRHLRANNNSIMDADGPFTINSVEAAQSYDSINISVHIQQERVASPAASTNYAQLTRPDIFYNGT